MTEPSKDQNPFHWQGGGIDEPHELQGQGTVDDALGTAFSRITRGPQEAALAASTDPSDSSKYPAITWDARDHTSGPGVNPPDPAVLRRSISAETPPEPERGHGVAPPEPRPGRDNDLGLSL